MSEKRRILRVRVPNGQTVSSRLRSRVDLRPWLAATAAHVALVGWAFTFDGDSAPPLRTYEVCIAYLGEVPAPPETAPAPGPQEPCPVEPALSDATPAVSPAPQDDRPADPPPAASVAFSAQPPAPPSESAPPDTPIRAASAPPDTAPAVLPLSGAAAFPPTPSVAASSPQDSRPAVVASSPAQDLAYWRDVRTDVIRHLRYPRMPEGAQIDTNIVLRISVDAKGRLIETVAGNDERSPFARAAIRAAQAAAPFSVPAGDIPLTVELPIHFLHAL